MPTVFSTSLKKKFAVAKKKVSVAKKKVSVAKKKVAVAKKKVAVAKKDFIMRKNVAESYILYGKGFSKWTFLSLVHTINTH